MSTFLSASFRIFSSFNYNDYFNQTFSQCFCLSFEFLIASVVEFFSIFARCEIWRLGRNAKLSVFESFQCITILFSSKFYFNFFVFYFEKRCLFCVCRPFQIVWFWLSFFMLVEHLFRHFYMVTLLKNRFNLHKIYLLDL